MEAAGRLDLVLVAILCAAVPLAAAAGWHAALGGTVTLTQVGARYAAGSLANTVLPARAGDALRLGLLASAVPGEGRARTLAAATAGLASLRTIAQAPLLPFAASGTGIPLWASIPTAVAVLAIVARTRPKCPLRAAGWIVTGRLARLGAAAALASAFSLHHPLALALILVPTLDLAGTVPLTPGNAGVASMAVAFVLSHHGADASAALGAGLVLHAAETACGLLFGLAGALYLVLTSRASASSASRAGRRTRSSRCTETPGSPRPTRSFHRRNSPSTAAGRTARTRPAGATG